LVRPEEVLLLDNKKERIVHSAIEVFQEKGIEKAKVSDIVKGAGIAQGTFYLYFSSKLAVMPSIAEVMVGKMLDTIKQEAEPLEGFREKLEKVVDCVFRLTEADRDVFALIYAGMAATEHLNEWESIYTEYYSWMAEQLETAKARNEIHSETVSDEAAVLVIGLIESAADQTYLFSPKGKLDANRKKQAVLQFAARALEMD